MNYRDRGVCDRCWTCATATPTDSTQTCPFVILGLVNIIAPGLGIAILGCYLNDSRDIWYGILQIVTSFIFIGVLWGVITGILLIVRGFAAPKKKSFKAASFDSVQRAPPPSYDTIQFRAPKKDEDKQANDNFTYGKPHTENA